MKNAAIFGACLILALLLAVPLLSNSRGNGDSAKQTPRHKLPGYAQRMGLNEVPRARYEACPFKMTYAETVECLGAPGVEIVRAEDLPPMPIKATMRMWTRHVQEPAFKVYASVNEYDEVMVTTFLNGESVSQYAGQPPE